MNNQTFTAVRSGAVLLERGAWSQVERVLERGYCVTGRTVPDAAGHSTLTLGLMFRKSERWPQLAGRDLNPAFLGAAPARAGQDY